MNKLVRLVATGAVALMALQAPLPTQAQHAQSTRSAVHIDPSRVPGAVNRNAPRPAVHAATVKPNVVGSTTGITIFPLSAPNTGSRGVTTDGSSIYVVDNTNKALEKINPATGLVIGSVATTDPPSEITFDPISGFLFVTESSGPASGTIERFTTAPGLSLSSPGFVTPPQGIVIDPAGNVCWTDPLFAFIDCYTTGLVFVNGVFTPLGSSPQYIATDGNNLYVTDSGLNAILAYSPSPALTLLFGPLTLHTGAANPQGITFNSFANGGDGNIWFTEEASNQIASLVTATHVITEYPIVSFQCNNCGPFQIAPGRDGRLYFSTDLNGDVGVLSPPTGGAASRPTGNRTTMFFVPSGRTWGVTAGPDGNIWFGDNLNPDIYVLAPKYALTGSGITFTATANVSFSGVIGQFTDARPTAVPPVTYAAVINWGDGTPLDLTGVITPLGGGLFSVSGTHTFTTRGTRSVGVTVTSSDARTANIFSKVIVSL